MTDDRTTPADEAELEAFLTRTSAVSAAYAAIDPIEPPEVLDSRVVALARAATSPAPQKPAVPAERPVPSRSATPAPSPPPPKAAGPSPTVPKPAPQRVPAARPADAEVDDEPPVARRPRWLLPAGLAASALIAVGVGVNLLGTGSSEPGAESGNPVGSLFAKRARERQQGEKAAAEPAAVATQAEADPEARLAPLPPPPVFEPEGPQVEDLDKAIVLIRRELVLANQLAATAEEAKAEEQSARDDARATAKAPKGAASLAPEPAVTGTAAGALADAAPAPEVVQPRDRRLAKILQLYDDGNPELAAASLEIFLRDFEDDPISRRIIEAQPRATDVAVE